MSESLSYNYVPRANIDTHTWHNSTPRSNQPHPNIDAYDSFDKLDHTITDYKDAVHNLNWIKKPTFEQILPKVTQKYRITVDVKGYDAPSIKTEILDSKTDGKKILVTGHEHEKFDEDGDFMLKHFKKTYDLPEHCELDKLASYIVQPSTLVIEMPLQEKEFHLDADLVPKITENESGEEILNLDFNIPEDIDPEHVHVTIKDHDFVLKAEDKSKKADGMSKFHYYKKARLPHNTNFEGLACKFNNNQISCTAALNPAFQHHEKADHCEKLWNRERPVFKARKYDFNTQKHSNICI